MVSPEYQQAHAHRRLHSERAVGDYMNRCLLRGSALAADANVLA